MFFPCGLGHMMGLDVHDMENLEAYRGFGGIRNEENDLITDTGHRLLGKPKPRSVKQVETLRAVAFG